MSAGAIYRTEVARDSDDALVCCIENTVEDHIMDSGASFHATYCKEELEMFKLCSGKVRLADDKTLDFQALGMLLPRRLQISAWKVTKGSLVVAHRNKRGSLYIVERLGDMSRIGMSMLAYKGNVPDVRKVVALHLLHQSEDPTTMILLSKTAAGVANGIVMLKMVPKTLLQFGIAERLGLLAEAPEMLWADLVSTAYLIYHIPYVLIGLRISEEEWRRKDTSLTQLKVFGCELFVKVKDVCGEAMKCTFIGSGSDEVRYSFRDTKSHQGIRSRDITFVDPIYRARSATNSSSLTKPIQKSQVVLVDIPENLAENDRIVAEHGLSSEITQSPGGSSNTSEGSENSGSFEGSGRSDKEDSEDGASSEEGGSKTPHVRRSAESPGLQ
ncbi:hypothetical protein Tco_1076355 [Tanacetum coccineum]